MELKVITSQAEYEEALKEVERLSCQDLSGDAKKVERLRLVATLVQNYERDRFKFSIPDPIDAIRFRMEEQGLQQVDLIPYIGSKSKVSEVLSRKRPLTLSMIRALSIGLGIPSDVLIQKADTAELDVSSPVRVPWKEMVNMGWVEETGSKAGVMSRFFAPLISFGKGNLEVLWRKSLRPVSQDRQKDYILAWTARILNRAAAIETGQQRIGDPERFMKILAQLSWSTRGPLLAEEFLIKHGIKLVVEPALKGSRVDGAAFLDSDGSPIIALALRYDRLDNFWFTLMHEVVHVFKHLKDPNDSVFDDFEGVSTDVQREREADRISKEVFIPRSKWSRSAAFRQRSRAGVIALAEELKIHPAIVVGRLHFETGDFSLFPDLIGQGEVRKLFTSWR